MKFFLILTVFFSSLFVFAAPITATKTTPKYTIPDDRPVHPIVRPPHRPILRPAVVAPVVVYEENYYTTNAENSCQQYVDQIADMKNKIASLNLEIQKLKLMQEVHLQDSLKLQHEQEMLKFDNRKSIKTKNSIEIKSK